MSRVRKWIRHQIAMAVAGDEIDELHALKCRIDDLKVWGSHIKTSKVAAMWLQSPKGYPCQFKGAHGSIEDFRCYLAKVESDEREKANARIEELEGEMANMVDRI